MAINDLPILSALRTKMQWHQERQRVLAENISNSNTPNFKPRDLVEPKFDNKGAPSSVGGTPLATATLAASLPNASARTCPESLPMRRTSLPDSLSHRRSSWYPPETRIFLSPASTILVFSRLIGYFSSHIGCLCGSWAKK